METNNYDWNENYGEGTYVGYGDEPSTEDPDDCDWVSDEDLSMIRCSQWPLLSCRGGRTCAVQPGPRVSTSGVPPRPGVSPPAAAFRARMASVVGFLLYWAAF